ncbi:hypothetical protein, partial [Burkholderia multivorans]|uniref:hypothetical protein n=1 Tax=Burkholderia multivorans TaxID=87883 RepID=UPI0020B400C7
NGVVGTVTGALGGANNPTGALNGVVSTVTDALGGNDPTGALNAWSVRLRAHLAARTTRPVH